MSAHDDALQEKSKCDASSADLMAPTPMPAAPTPIREEEPPPFQEAFTAAAASSSAPAAVAV